MQRLLGVADLYIISISQSESKCMNRIKIKKHLPMFNVQIVWINIRTTFGSELKYQYKIPTTPYIVHVTSPHTFQKIDAYSDTIHGFNPNVKEWVQQQLKGEN